MALFFTDSFIKMRQQSRSSSIKACVGAENKWRRYKISKTLNPKLIAPMKAYSFICDGKMSASKIMIKVTTMAGQPKEIIARYFEIGPLIWQ